jgi:hypothetical protein
VVLRFLLLRFLMFSMSILSLTAAFTAGHWPANFSANLGSGMVLQRAPAQASVYGFVGDLSDAAVSSASKPLLSLSVTNGGATESYTPSIYADGTWKATLSAKPAGGTYTIRVACTSGCANSAATTMNDVTFGDVW